MKVVRKFTTVMLAMALAMLLLLTACSGGDSSTVTLTLQANNSSYGTVSGGGTYAIGSYVDVKATPYTGYKFKSWQQNGKVVSTNASTTFILSSSATLTAVFEKTTTYTITAQANNSSYGTVSGGGTYNSGALVTLKAIPKEGYTFRGWQKDGSTVSYADSTYSFFASSSCTVTAVFEKGEPTTNTLYNVVVAANNSSYGSVTGGGSYTAGSSVTVTATPASGYAFKGWQKNGSTVSTDTSYTFTASADCTLTAVFEKVNVSVAINETNFPDEKFRSYVSTNFDKDGDGILSGSEIAAVTKINVYGLLVADLKGIEYFTNLKTLNCWFNYLTSLDVSENTALEYLNCGNGRLTSLNVSRNTALTYLDCNINSLTSLDVTRNTALTDLICYNNKLTSLDVSKNTALTSLTCFSNQLTSLDVSKNIALTSLNCHDNQLTSLNISKNTNLKGLYCYNNKLTSLDISNNSDLKTENLNAGTSVTVIKGDSTFTYARISVFVTNVEGCRCSGGGKYVVGDTATVKSSTSASGYHFKGWVKNGVTVCTSEEYTFTVTESCTLCAIYEPDCPENLKPYTYTSVSYNGNDYSNYYVLKNFSESACYKMGNYSALASSGCTAVADAAAYTAQTGIVVNPLNSWKSGVGCIWKWCSVQQPTWSVSQQLSQIYTNIMNGKATIVRFKNSVSVGHSVAVVGVRKDADQNNLTVADFLVIDPSRGKVMNGSQVTANGKAAYMYDRPDGKDYCLRVTP